MTSTITWQDPQIEYDLIQEFLQSGKHVDLLILGNSVDTCSYLYNDTTRIKMIVTSSVQIHVFHLKYQILRHIKKPKERIQFLEGTMDIQKMIKIFCKLRRELPRNSRKFWMKNLSAIFIGIFKIDKWLKIFNSKKFNHSRLKKVIDPVHFYFTLENPIKEKIIDAFKKTALDIKSRYCYQMLSGKCNVKSPPKYLGVDDYPLIWDRKLEILKGNLYEFLLNNREKFRMISVGNMLDSFYPDERNHVIELLSNRITSDGIIIFRSMCNDFPIYPDLKKYLMILNWDRNHTDRTYLYKEVYICGKKSR